MKFFRSTPKPEAPAPAPPRRAPETLDDCVRRLLRERAAAAPPPTPHQIEKQLAREREAEARREEDRAAAMREAMAMALVRDRMWDPRDPPEFEALRRPRWWPRSWRW